MKAIPIKYIQEMIEALDECENDTEIRGGGKLVNKLYCISRKNALTNLINYWNEDKKEWGNE